MINNKQQTIIEKIKEVFEGENMQSECSVLSYRVDIYFKNINFQYKSMNLGMMIEILIMIYKDKKE